MVGALALLAICWGVRFFGCRHGFRPYDGVCRAQFSQLVHTFNTRSEHSLFSVGFLSNPKWYYLFLLCTLMQFSVIGIAPLGALFKTVPLDGMQWLVVAALSLAPLVTVEIGKRMKPRNSPK